MTKIKICGLSRVEDIEYVNITKPDYAGFIIDFPKSHRSIDYETAKNLISMLDENIKSVCVFVNKSTEYIEKFKHVCEVVQLHGDEDDDFILNLKNKIPETEIWKAFKIRDDKDISFAKKSSADMILLDNGYGTGETFDWGKIENIGRDFILAGGINIENAQNAIKNFKPYALDISSGVETNKKKDFEKIKQIIKKVRSEV